MSEENNILTEEEELEQQHEQSRIRREKLSALQAAGKDPFVITKFDFDAKAADIRAHFTDMDGKEVKLAGRMMSRRIMGKASFMDIRDSSDRMQVYVKRDDIGVDEYADFKKWDIGDIVGVEGVVFRTQKGEISVHANKLTLLS